MKKILLIEDNKEISENIKSYLELENYDIDIAFSWDIGLDKAMRNNYDLILLDLMLPEIDWFTVSKRLLKDFKVPIIMITAKDSIDDKLRWFKSWALDYIVKPFDLRELEVRIKSMLFRWSANNSEVFSFNNIEISISKRIFKKDWMDINITQKDFLILELLFDNLESWVSRTNIIEHVWWESEIFDADWKLDVYISTLRKKLDKDLIKTIKWYWYRINIS